MRCSPGWLCAAGGPDDASRESRTRRTEPHVAQPLDLGHRVGDQAVAVDGVLEDRVQLGDDLVDGGADLVPSWAMRLRPLSICSKLIVSIRLRPNSGNRCASITER